MYDYLIIGAGIAGLTAAETIRSRDHRGLIAIFGDEAHPTYSRVMLPNVVRGKVGEGRAILKTPPEVAAKHIDLHLGRRVTAVNTALHSVILDNGQEVGYKKLLIATGGRARRLDIPGANETPIRYFQTLDDARILRDLPKTSGAVPPQAVVVGGGFIGIELLMAYVERGYHTTIICRGDGLFSQILDPQSRARLEQILTVNGVQIIKHTQVQSISSPLSLTLSTGQNLSTHELACGIGLDLNTDFVQHDGITINRGIVVDHQLRTSAPDVYAAGDVAEFDHRIIGNWQNALFQGRLAGENMTDAGKSYTVVTTYSIHCFNTPVIFIGNTDPHPATTRQVLSRPNSTLQLIYKNDQLIGATCVGPCPERAKLIEEIQNKSRD